MNDWIDPLLLVVALAALAIFFLLRRRGDATESTGTQASPFRIHGHYRRALRQAGYEPRSFLLFFWALKVILAVLVPLLLVQILEPWIESVPFAVVLLAALLGFFGPDFWLAGTRKERRRKIAHSLPYFLDLVVAFLRSGLGLEEAFRRAGREGFESDHPLGREVVLVAREIDLGKERSMAFRALAERTGVPAMKAIAAALESGVRLGASVEATLRSQADLLRAQRREDTLRRVQMAAIKALLPVLLCGFPLFVVIVFFPAVQELIRTFAFLTGS